MSQENPSCLCLPTFTNFASLLREDETGWHDPVRLVLLDLGQLLLVEDDLDGIGVDQVVDLEQLGFSKQFQLCFGQLLLVQLLATLLGQIGQRSDIILQLLVHLVVDVVLVQLLEVLQVTLVGNHWVVFLVAPLSQIISSPHAKDFGLVGDSFIWCWIFKSTLHTSVHQTCIFFRKLIW